MRPRLPRAQFHIGQLNVKLRSQAGWLILTQGETAHPTLSRCNQTHLPAPLNLTDHRVCFVFVCLNNAL